MRQILIFCGMLSSLVYLGMVAFIPLHYGGYDFVSQTVSEISAIDTPTRPVWTSWIIVYTVLLVAFGCGVVWSARSSRAQQIVGTLMIIHAVFGLFWPPMHQREVLAAGGRTISDTMHIVWTMITIPMFLLEIGLAARLFSKRFQWYSILSIVIIIVFGIITGLDSPEMEANLLTPWMGIWERISISGYMVWVMIFSCHLLKMNRIPIAT